MRLKDVSVKVADLCSQRLPIKCGQDQSAEKSFRYRLRPRTHCYLNRESD
jgi:hypothetical protein